VRKWSWKVSTPDYFARVVGSINLSLLQSRRVVVAGVGTVGSQIVAELARCGVGQFTLIDGDHYEETNRVRHVLPKEYVGVNKAEAMTRHLSEEVPLVPPRAVTRDIDDSMTDDQLDALLEDADLVVAATDDREAQRRIGRRALSLDIPAIFPALYGDAGGEVVVQLDSRFPCFFCWDGFRPNDAQVRGVAAHNATTLPVIAVAVALALAILDPASEHRRMLGMESRTVQWGTVGRPNQLFVVQGVMASLRMAPIPRRPDCPSCAVGPAHGRVIEPVDQPQMVEAPDEIVEAVLRVRSRLQDASPAPREADRPSIGVDPLSMIAGLIGEMLLSYLELMAPFVLVGGGFLLFLLCLKALT
jgi:molybdopterin/thiamine biosynthesis adenylyltransferase